MTFKEALVALINSHVPSLSLALTDVYHSSNRNPHISQQVFKDKVAITTTPFRSYSDLVKLLYSEQARLHLTPAFSGAFALLNFTAEISEICGCSEHDISDALDKLYFSSDCYSPYFVHKRGDIIACGHLSGLDRYISKNDINYLDKFYLVLGRSEAEARAIAVHRSMQPLNPLRAINLLNGDFDEGLFSPMVGTVFSSHQPVYQSANPMGTILKLFPQKKRITDLVKKIGVKQFEAAAYYRESTRTVELNSNLYTLPNFWVCCDVSKAQILDGAVVEEISNKDKRFHPIYNILKFCEASKNHRVVRLGLDEVFGRLPSSIVTDIGCPSGPELPAGLIDQLIDWAQHR